MLVTMNPRQKAQYAEIQRQLRNCPADKRWYWQQMLDKLLKQTGARQ
jgi:hypothetical protein